MKPAIIVSPVEEFASPFLERLCRKIEEVLPLQVKVERLLESIDFAYDSHRKQYYSTKILERLSQLASEKALKVLALTRQDLFIPILTHVFGEAQLRGTSCIVSVNRLFRDFDQRIVQEELLDNRVLKESLHELGHTFNLTHCREKSCIMHYCRQIQDVDQKSTGLCKYCQILLQDELKVLGLA